MATSLCRINDNFFRLEHVVHPVAVAHFHPLRQETPLDFMIIREINLARVGILVRNHFQTGQLAVDRIENQPALNVFMRGHQNVVQFRVARKWNCAQIIDLAKASGPLRQHPPPHCQCDQQSAAPGRGERLGKAVSKIRLHFAARQPDAGLGVGEVDPPIAPAAGQFSLQDPLAAGAGKVSMGGRGFPNTILV